MSGRCELCRTTNVIIYGLFHSISTTPTFCLFEDDITPLKMHAPDWITQTRRIFLLMGKAVQGHFKDLFLEAHTRVCFWSPSNSSVDHFYPQIKFLLDKPKMDSSTTYPVYWILLLNTKLCTYVGWSSRKDWGTVSWIILGIHTTCEHFISKMSEWLPGALRGHIRVTL